MKQKWVVIFVEGETDKLFYKALIKYYIEYSKCEVVKCDVYSIDGFGNFDSKVISKLKNGIKPKIEKCGGEICAVVCSYDTDVFEYAAVPPINWSKVKRGVKSQGVDKFVEVKAKQMIEDWFLKDVDGLCKFLKIKIDNKPLTGKDGAKRMQSLFKMANKLYHKGRYTQNFISALDIAKIRSAILDELTELENVLNVEI